MKVVILKADAPLLYKGEDYELLLFGGCEINKVDDLIWDKVKRDYSENLKLLQERNVLIVNEEGTSKKVDENGLQDLVHDKLKEQKGRTPKAITNKEQEGEEL